MCAQHDSRKGIEIPADCGAVLKCVLLRKKEGVTGTDSCRVLVVPVRWKEERLYMLWILQFVVVYSAENRVV